MEWKICILLYTLFRVMNSKLRIWQHKNCMEQKYTIRQSSEKGKSFFLLFFDWEQLENSLYKSFHAQFAITLAGQIIPYMDDGVTNGSCQH